jgi:two-component system NtrC family sensor kinase
MAMDWETAFFEQYQDACIGRMLRGIIHNLNGANQAFSLQASLFKNMFEKAESLLLEVERSSPECAGGVKPLQELLSKRAVMAEQMEEKVEVSQKIVSRILPLAQLYGIRSDCAVTLDTIVGLETEIMTADSFFKHQVKKVVDLPPDLPGLLRHCAEIHVILFTLMDNALAAMRGSAAPEMRLSARQAGESLIIEVRDTGHGIDPQITERIFEPFFSTREGALGVGLYQARKLVAALGGTIEFSSAPNDTCFTVTLPLVELV